MTEEQFKQKQKAMPNTELIERARKEVLKLCKSSKNFTMSIPHMITDTDHLLMEVIDRFEELLNTKKG